jgi:hypothetical protein
MSRLDCANVAQGEIAKHFKVNQAADIRGAAIAFTAVLLLVL